MNYQYAYFDYKLGRLEYRSDENGKDLPKTIISREYSSEWKPCDEPYYPVNDEKIWKNFVPEKICRNYMCLSSVTILPR